ncbi:MAG: UDP-N-acetylmuramate dehydrogenase [Flavobacteriales bacterium]|nr:UDP-N-acetylmuramate dehydrogenase [Flavobacteriales bacterium]
MSIQISENISLRHLNTFGIEAMAEKYLKFNSLDDLQEWREIPGMLKSNVLVLGGGSNILFTKDFKGVILHNQLHGIELIEEDENHFYVRSAAGEPWDSFVQLCVKNNWAGVENLSLIPGSVGAAPMQNIGAYGVEIKDVFHSLEAFHIQEGYLKTFDLQECKFGYRESVFKGSEKGKWIISSVTFRLLKRPVFKTNYGAIQEELEKLRPDRLSISDISRAVVNIRTSKLPNPAILGNAGSFFENPVVSMELANTIKQKHADAPIYPVNVEVAKVAAGWLIEKCGWKGKVVGNCGMHAKQALVLVNYGGATGAEVLAFSEQVMSSVFETFGVQLKREVNIV